MLSLKLQAATRVDIMLNIPPLILRHFGMLWEPAREKTDLKLRQLSENYGTWWWWWDDGGRHKKERLGWEVKTDLITKKQSLTSRLLPSEKQTNSELCGFTRNYVFPWEINAVPLLGEINSRAAAFEEGRYLREMKIYPADNEEDYEKQVKAF